MLHERPGIRFFVNQVDVLPLVPLPVEFILPNEVPSQNARLDFCNDCFDFISFAAELNFDFLLSAAVDPLTTDGLEVESVVDNVIRAGRYD